MDNSPYRCGARGSRLSIAQARSAIAFLRATVNGFDTRLFTFKTPGDRDLVTPIEDSAPDFFTHDLDDAVRDGRIDFAIHSAKDLPEDIADDLDWFWLPIREDPRDCWVMRMEKSEQFGLNGRGRRQRHLRIGSSSARREAYARDRFPNASFVPMRGAVDARLRQLSEGCFDAALMAMAGLKRLYPKWNGESGELVFGDGTHLKVVPIPVGDLPPPEGQGVLAISFRKGDARLSAIRRRFVKAVRFASAGVGNVGLITIRGMMDIEEADIVLADELSGFGGPSSFAKGRPHGCRAEWVNVGKRCGSHSMAQDEITKLICNEVRKGKRVVRLKGGDAGVFGRLAEETAELDMLDIPYVIRPGVSALTAATTPNGLFLTMRGISRGFHVSTPRSSGKAMPHVFFMAAQMANETLKKFSPETPYAMIWDACGPFEKMEIGVCGNPKIAANDSPGLLVVGCRSAPFARKRVLLTCSETVMRRAVCRFEDCGWNAVEWSMIAPEPCEGASILVRNVEKYDAVVLTSPSAVRMFFDMWDGDRRLLPKLWTCGIGTDIELRRFGVKSDIMPEDDFSSKGLVRRIGGERIRGLRVLRLRSAKAGREVAMAIKRYGAMVDDVVMYDTKPVKRHSELPPCEAVFFASASAVDSFLAQYGCYVLADKRVFVAGTPTRKALPGRICASAELFPIVQKGETQWIS